MSRNQFCRILVRTVVGTGLLILLGGLLIVVEQRRSQAETSAVLSSFFTQQVLPDADKSSSGRPVEIVIERRPSCQMCTVDGEVDSSTWFGQSLRTRGSTLSRGWFVRSARTTRFSFFVNNVRSTDIPTDWTLPNGARAVFIDPSDLQINSNSQPRFREYFVVSHVGLNLNKTEALFYVEHFCGGLCAGGDYYRMRKFDGAWHIVDRHNVWVS